jgi:AraC-like DNA-binding protein
MSIAAAAPPPQDPPQPPPVRVRRVDFADVEALAAAARQGNIDMHLVRGGRYRGGILDVETDGLGIEWGFHEVPIVAHGEAWAEGAFLASWSGAPSRANGLELAPGGFVYYAPHDEHQARTDGAMSWVSIRVSELEQLAAILAPELRVGAGHAVRLFDDAPRAIASVRRALSDVRHAAETGSPALRDPNAARAIRDTVGTSLVRMMAAERPRPFHEGIAAASALVRRAVAHLAERGFQPVFVPELCAAVAASEARLRDAFLRVYRVGPARYLRLRRLHLVRRALRTTRPDELTVSAAAARHGFFQFGRFAGDYRAFFGELPSRTERAR